MNFIKLYHSINTDDDTLATLHWLLKLMLAFARHKSEKVRLKVSHCHLILLAPSTHSLLVLSTAGNALFSKRNKLGI